MGILPPLLPTSMDLPFPSLIYYGIGYAPREGEKGMHGRSSKRPTVGRLDDLQWVFGAIYGRSFLRCVEGVGFFG